MQQLLEHGTANQQHSFIRDLEHNTGIVCRSAPGRNVVGTALSHGAQEDRALLARAISKEAGLLQVLAQARHGGAIVAFLLQVLDGDEREQARLLLSEDLSTLEASRYGRCVAGYLEASSEE